MRDRHLDLPLTAEELAMIRTAATARGLTMAAFARTTLLEKAREGR